jgi:uncharacterized RDD family membrane protein YckC
VDNYVDPYEKTYNDRRSQPADLECADFLPRLIAGLIDGLIVGFVNIFLLTAAFYVIISSVSLGSATNGESPGLSPVLCGMYFGSFATVFIIQWLYFALLECSPFMATPGKIALGLKVTDECGGTISFSQATRRYVAKMLTNVFLCIGTLSILFSENGQSIYDKISNTYVVKK